MKKLGLTLLAIGIIGGIGLLILKQQNREKKNNLKPKQEEETSEIEEIKVEEESIKSETVSDAIKKVVKKLIRSNNIKSRFQFGEQALRLIIPNVPITELDKVPKNIDELETLLKELELWNEYETYLEDIYKK